jgi:hypothetical protein
MSAAVHPERAARLLDALAVYRPARLVSTTSAHATSSL